MCGGSSGGGKGSAAGARRDCHTRLPRQRKACGSDVDPHPAEVGKLLCEAHSQFVAFIGLCAFGGLRLGEAAALRVGDVDFLKREIRVSHQVQRANGKQVEIRPPKYGSERIIYVPDELIETISEHVRDIPAWRRRGPLVIPWRGCHIHFTRTPSVTYGARRESGRGGATDYTTCATSTPAD